MIPAFLYTTQRGVEWCDMLCHVIKSYLLRTCVPMSRCSILLIAIKPIGAKNICADPSPHSTYYVGHRAHSSQPTLQTEYWGLFES
jgi:hypothetical protein